MAAMAALAPLTPHPTIAMSGEFVRKVGFTAYRVSARCGRDGGMSLVKALTFVFVVQLTLLGVCPSSAGRPLPVR